MVRLLAVHRAFAAERSPIRRIVAAKLHIIHQVRWTITPNTFDIVSGGSIRRARNTYLAQICSIRRVLVRVVGMAIRVSTLSTCLALGVL